MVGAYISLFKKFSHKQTMSKFTTLRDRKRVLISRFSHHHVRAFLPTSFPSGASKFSHSFSAGNEFDRLGHIAA